MSTTILVNNRLVTVQDYMKTFKVCFRTAKKMLAMDMEDLKVKRLVCSRFYQIYERYPAKFQPILKAVPIDQN